MLTISVRAAQQGEYALLRSLMTRAFGADETNLWDYLTQHDSSVTPAHIRVADAGGEPVACTVVVPRQIRTRAGLAPGAIITLVACEPALQGQGYGGATVRDALCFMAEQGLSVAILYGHPTYYPRFGFVPVLPGYSVELPVAGGAGTLRPTTPADAPWLTRLYAAEAGQSLCAVARTAEPWLWAPRKPEHAVLALPDAAGYAHVSAGAESGTLWVWEAAAADAPATRRLLDALMAEAQARKLQRLGARLSPDHALARLMALRGGRETLGPAAAGMVALPRWDGVLPAGFTAGPNGLAYEGRPVLEASHESLVGLAMGYRSVDDLLLDGTATLPAGAPVDLLRCTFGPAFPKWSLAPFWE